jgi:hypothetical protein
MSSNNAEKRAKFLKQVEGLVCKDRNVQHGDAEDNFRNIAKLWTDYLAMRPNGPLHSYEVGIMMTLFKIARMVHNPTNQDNWLDSAGYMACGGVIAEGIKEPEVKQRAPQDNISAQEVAEVYRQPQQEAMEAAGRLGRSKQTDFNPC